MTAILHTTALYKTFGRTEVLRGLDLSAGSPAEDSAGQWRLSYSPFPADLRIQPIDLGGDTTFPPVDAVQVVTRAPIAHVKTVAEMRGVRLRDLE